MQDEEGRTGLHQPPLPANNLANDPICSGLAGPGPGCGVGPLTREASWPEVYRPARPHQSPRRVGVSGAGPG